MPCAATNFENAMARLEIEHAHHQLADPILVLVQRRELPIQRRVVDLFGDTVVLPLGPRFDRAEFGRPNEIRHVVLDRKAATLGRYELSVLELERRVRIRGTIVLNAGRVHRTPFQEAFRHTTTHTCSSIPQKSLRHEPIAKRSKAGESAALISNS